MIDEEQLVKAAQKDPAAFRQLYPHYVGRLYAYIGYRVGRKQDIEDLVSETFLRALQGIGKFDYRGEGSLAAWLFGIAYRVLQEFYRHDIAEISFDELPAIHHDQVEDVVIKQEDFVRLRHLLNQLTPRQREIILLRYYGALRNQAIAELLAVDERTVATHLSRGIQTLQALYQAEIEVHHV